jgi:hypothetical protein
VVGAAALVAFHDVPVSVLGVAFASKANARGELGSSFAFAALRFSFVEGEGFRVVFCGESCEIGSTPVSSFSFSFAFPEESAKLAHWFASDASPSLFGESVL